VTDRTYSAEEHQALLEAAVTRETATATQRIADLEAELESTRSKLDVSEAAVVTEKAARETAEQSLADFKSETEAREAAIARSGEREKKVREAAAHLDDEKFNAYATEERKARWAGLSDDAFAEHVAEIAELAKGAPKADGENKPPRETAMNGQTPKVGAEQKAPALARFLGLAADEKVGA
jgi:chromosome segregation ATPase